MRRLPTHAPRLQHEIRCEYSTYETPTDVRPSPPTCMPTTALHHPRSASMRDPSLARGELAADSVSEPNRRRSRQPAVRGHLSDSEGEVATVGALLALPAHVYPRTRLASPQATHLDTPMARSGTFFDVRPAHAGLHRRRRASCRAGAHGGHCRGTFLRVCVSTCPCATLAFAHCRPPLPIILRSHVHVYLHHLPPHCSYVTIRWSKRQTYLDRGRRPIGSWNASARCVANAALTEARLKRKLKGTLRGIHAKSLTSARSFAHMPSSRVKLQVRRGRRGLCRHAPPPPLPPHMATHRHTSPRPPVT